MHYFVPNLVRGILIFKRSHKTLTFISSSNHYSLPSVIVCSCFARKDVLLNEYWGSKIQQNEDFYIPTCWCEVVCQLVGTVMALYHGCCTIKISPLLSPDLVTTMGNQSSLKNNPVKNKIMSMGPYCIHGVNYLFW